MRTIALLLAAAGAFAQNLTIRNVTVIDANGPRPRSTVHVAGGRITANAPAGATVIDGSGKFLIPGLWDMHVHLWESDPMTGLYIANGVIGLRDMGSDLKRTRQLRADIVAGRAAGPIIYTSGQFVDGPGGAPGKSPAIVAVNAEDGRRATDTIDTGLGDFVKVMSRLSEDAYFALAQRARVTRTPFAGHLPEAVSALDAIDARQKSIEHLFGMAIACSPQESTLRRERLDAIAKKDYVKLRDVRSRAYASFSPVIANELFRRMARYGVYQCPTLTMRRRVSLMGLEELVTAPEQKYVPKAVQQTWIDPRGDLKEATPELLQNFKEDDQFHAKLLPLMRRAGVGLLAGTDTGDSYVVPGFALHDELALLVEAGLSPDEALTAATLEPARYFGLEDTLGTVAVGKTASLVLLDADPLKDIRNTRRISSVILKGRLLDRKCLDTLLAGKSAPCAFVSLQPSPPASSAKRPASSRRRGSRTR